MILATVWPVGWLSWALHGLRGPELAADPAYRPRPAAV